MKFTVGMATYDDFDGFYFTANSLLHYHKQYVNEIVVVENKPLVNDNSRIKEYCKKNSRIKYVNYSEVEGTAAPRNEVFKQATNEHVVCVDSHILVCENGFQKLAEFYQQMPNAAQDLVQGPLLYDSLNEVATHFSEEWGAGMKGKWTTDSTAFPLMKVKFGDREVSTRVRDEYGTPVAIKPWFEIPAMGLGLFASTKTHWLGFNDNFRGFGGEEWYIHDKYRKHGRKCWSVSGLMWIHRFRDNTNRYGDHKRPAKNFDKFRNHIIGFHENGKRLEEVIFHFIKDSLIQENDVYKVLEEVGVFDVDVEAVVADAKKTKDETSGCAPCEAARKAREAAAKYNNNNTATLPAASAGSYELQSVAPKLEAWVTGLKQSSTDLEKIVTEFSNLDVETVIQEGGHIGITAPAIAYGGKVKDYYIVKSKIPGDFKLIKGAIANKCNFEYKTEYNEKADLVILDAGKNNSNFINELNRRKGSFNKYLAFVNVAKDNKETNKRHLLEFLKNNPLIVVKFESATTENENILITSVSQEDVKNRPSLMRMAWNFSKFQAAHLTSGKRMVTPEVAAERLDTCLTCPLRSHYINGDNEYNSLCSDCGCWLEEFNQQGIKGPGKIWYAVEACPKGKWDKETDARRLIPLTTIPTQPTRVDGSTNEEESQGKKGFFSRLLGG